MKSLNLKTPRSWSELSQLQLDFLLRTITKVNTVALNRKFFSQEDFSAQTAAEVAVRCLFEWNNIEVVTPYADGWLIAHDGDELVINADSLTAATSFMSWISELPSEPVRLNVIDGATAIEASLDDSFSFDDWLSCEALWQGFQTTQNNDYLRQMAELLYRKPGISLQDHEFLCIFYWWAGLKAECNRLYPNFLQPATPGTATEPSPELMRRNMDAQIRALTKGDITKEEVVLSISAHRALTELDALAREYDDLNRKYGTK